MTGQINLFDEIIVDNFAGGGGASTGIELAVALSEGLPWLGFQCRKSRVLYVNFEIAAPSFAHRVDDVFKAYGTEATGHNLQVWNLRGKSMSMSSNDKKKGFDKRLIQRVVRDGHYDVIIIDPIYKVLDGDENSAADIRSFCNSLDLICERTNCCAIYVHHHSKGSKWGAAAIDRASGSGVFGRDAVIAIREEMKSQRLSTLPSPP